MDMETRSTDSKGRICLPKAFANATVILDQVSDTEVRIRKAVVIPEDEVRFYEETATPLSDLDRDRFLDLLDNPPAANAALMRATREARQASWMTGRSSVWNADTSVTGSPAASPRSMNSSTASSVSTRSGTSAGPMSRSVRARSRCAATIRSRRVRSPSRTSPNPRPGSFPGTRSR